VQHFDVSDADWRDHARKEAFMNRVKKTTSILLLVSTPMMGTAAQNPPAKKPSTEQAATEKAPPSNPLPQKITAALDQVLEAQKSFTDERLRIMIQAQVADILWSYDEPRARRLFEGVLQVSERLADQDASSPQSGGVSPYPARSEVIRLIMPHDSDWATKLVESRGDIVGDMKSRSAGKNRERTLLQLQAVIYFVQRDPRRAALAAKPFAESGDFNSLMNLLGLTRSKDVSAADELFLQALAKAKLGQPTFEDIRRFATYVFPSFGQGVLRFSSDPSARDPLAPANSGPAVMEQFLDLAYDAATRRLDSALSGEIGARLDPRHDFAIPKLLAPYFDRYLPERAPAFRARVQEALRRVPPGERPYLAVTDPGTVEELLSRADAMGDPGLKDALIRRAVSQASSRGDFEQAAAIIERLSNEGARSNARNMLRQTMDDKRTDEAWSALNKGEGDLDKAEALTAELSEWRPSSGLLVRSLVGRMARKDKPRAARILDEHERRAAAIEEPTERSLRLMQLAGFAESIDLDLAFEKMKQAIAEFNQAGFAPELSRYRDQGIGGAAGNPAERINIGLGGLLNNWDLYWLGRKDFERGVALAQRFQMREARALILLNACRGALVNVPASAR